jgi:signal transduction histidine kinase/CheY-like chemotaxis protein/HPt (histidine-containing phosphotransfer) domain-containing protein
MIPVVVDGQVLGYFEGGQVLYDEPFSREETDERAQALGIDPDSYYEAAKAIPVLSKGELDIKLHAIYPLLEFIVKIAYEEYKVKEESQAYEREAKMKSDFLANMSHEIRTPMNAVIGMAEMALREELPDNARDHIMQIQSAGQSLLGIINDILDFSKIESGKMDINMVDYEPLKLINDVANVIETRIGNKNVELLVDFDPDIPKYLMGDDSRIRQIIMNLANNAVKFTNEGTVTIKVECIPDKERSVLLRVSVADSGIGIKPEDMNKLFQSFQQVDSKRNRNVEGTGLGLAISKQLVTLMNGRISVESEYNKGSVFSFEIPQILLRDEGPSLYLKKKPQNPVVVITNNGYLQKGLERDFKRIGVPMERTYVVNQKETEFYFVDEAVYTEPIAKFVRQHPESKVVLMEGYDSSKTSPYKNLLIIKKPIYCRQIIQILNGEYAHLIHVPKEQEVQDFVAPEAKVLLVDDNEVNLAVAEGLLEPLQMQVDCVTSGADAIKKIEETHYDLIFMDHMMPEMDGVETTRLIRRYHPDYNDVPIIALTANAMEEAKSMFLVEGMNDFVAKPIEGAVLFRVTKQWLPAEKIHIVEKQEQSEENTRDSEEAKKLSRLRELKILDVDYGLSIMGTEKLYWKVLKDYYDVIDNKADRLQKAFDKEEWLSYGIEAHALKSSSKMIGAMELSKMAEAMEMAAKDNDETAIREHHREMMKKYTRYKKLLEPFVTDGEKQEQNAAWLGVKELREVFAELRRSFDELDMDAMEEAVEKMSGYRCTREEEECRQQLQEAVKNLDVEAGESWLAQWDSLLQQ